MHTVNLFIGGHHCPAASGKRFERSNPITGDVATSAAAATVEDATQHLSQGGDRSWEANKPLKRAIPASFSRR